jgi:AmmeMemoRadiSam system protein B
MSNLFNSYTDPVPPVRYDVQRIPVQQDGQSFIYFHDQMGYATADFAIPSEAEPILSLINGQHSAEDILRFGSDEITKEHILEYVQFLDEHRLLYSEHFLTEADRIETEYEASDIHKSSTAGSSYPSDPNKLQAFLDAAFDELEQSDPVDSATALFAPHIDVRVGLSSYVKAFSSILKLKPKKVIILATSHYSGLYPDLYKEAPFIVSDKTFRMPNGDITTDPELIQRLKKAQADLGEESGLAFNDRAHRIEHSIELHLLFLNYIWSHDFQILPILVGGMDELFYSDDSFRRKQLDMFSSILKELRNEDTFFLVSGDLSHFGRKFGDEKEAASMFEEVRPNDEKFMQISETGSPDQLIDLMKKDFDPYRICGFPPLLTFLNTFEGIKGSQVSYDLWDERERQSAVSFASILY